MLYTLCFRPIRTVIFLNTTQVKLEYEIKEVAPDGVTVIIVAAGSSTRMNGENKQFVEIDGIPVIARTMLAFERSSVIKRIILVTRTEDIFATQLIAEKYSLSKLSDIVCGAETRQQSVLKGFERLDEADEKVLVHDGARPLVTTEIIAAVAEALKTNEAVTCAVRLKDTVKQTDNNGRAVKTLDRSSLVAVQTPQGVWVKEYLRAVRNAADVAGFTDDMSVMESAGYMPYIVEGSYKNIKITTPEDVIAARAYSRDGIF